MAKTVEFQREQRKKIEALQKEYKELTEPAIAEDGTVIQSAVAGKRKKKQDPAQIKAKIEEL